MRGNPYGTTELESSAEPNSNSSTPTAGGTEDAYTELEKTPFPDTLRLDSADTWSDVVAKLAKAIDKPLFSDAYTAARGIRPDRGLDGSLIPPLSLSADGLRTPSKNLADGLDLICRAYNMVWWQQNGTLFFRSRTWLVERCYEVPVAIRKNLLAQIRNLPEQSVVRDQKAAAILQTLSGLSLHQLQGLIGTDKPGEYIPFYWSSRDSLPDAGLGQKYLRFFTNLTPEQQNIVIGKQGVALATMGEAQQAAFVSAVMPDRGWRTLSAEHHLVFSVRLSRLRDLPRGPSERQGACIAIRFHYTDDTNTAPYYYVMAITDEQPPATKLPEGKH